MGSGASFALEGLEMENVTEEEVRRIISGLPKDVQKMMKQVLDSTLEEEYFYDVASMRGNLNAYRWKAEIASGEDPHKSIKDDMEKARETFNRPVNLPAIYRPVVPEVDEQKELCYHNCPESNPDYSKVPRGKIIPVLDWQGAGDKTLYPGIKRDMEIYIPAQFTEDMEPALMLFNDGADYIEDIRPCEVLDSLIHAGTIPVTIAVFLEYGRPVDAAARREQLARAGISREILPEGPTHCKHGPVEAWGTYQQDKREILQRCIEYDTVTDKFPRFLRDEVLPVVLETARVKKFSSDPSQRCIVGHSSGGLSAFNAAWHDPQTWGRVLCHNASFAAIDVGHNYPFIVRRSDRAARKHLRIVLSSGSYDEDNAFGNWALLNHSMADALRYAGYDYRYNFGSGGHNTMYGSSLLAEHLRWLFARKES